ncbi:hypothetical protein D3C87_1773670 [compost metagenome]
MYQSAREQIIPDHRCGQPTPAETTANEMVLGWNVADPPGMVGEHIEVAACCQVGRVGHNELHFLADVCQRQGTIELCQRMP